jgi:hypothetical protein
VVTFTIARGATDARRELILLSANFHRSAATARVQRLKFWPPVPIRA